MRTSRWNFPLSLKLIRLPSYSVIAADALRNLVTLTFDLLTLFSGHTWRVNRSTKFEYPTAIRSWVMSSDMSHRIPLTMRLQQLRMRRITWPMRRGKFSPHIWNPWSRFAFSLYNFYDGTITFKGRFALSTTNFKAVLRPKISYRLNGPQNGGFARKSGVDVKFWFCDPQKAHPCAEPRLVTYFALMSVVASWL